MNDEDEFDIKSAKNKAKKKVKGASKDTFGLPSDFTLEDDVPFGQ